MEYTVPIDQIPINLSGPEGDKYIADLDAGKLTPANPPATVAKPGEGSPGDGGEQPPSTLNIGRQYDYNQIIGGLYEIYPEEISDVIELGFAKVRSK